jgi:hypothetical protein
MLLAALQSTSRNHQNSATFITLGLNGRESAGEAKEEKPASMGSPACVF